MISNRVCTIPLTVIYAAPYNLAQGSAIGATAVATNFYGNSTMSTVGTGAIVVVVPF
jgi:hypothetical protein